MISNSTGIHRTRGLRFTPGDHVLSRGAAVLGLSLALFGCSGSGSSSSTGGAMFIESCSLGCANAAGGTAIGCALVNISQNAEVSILFSQPVQIGSVNTASFQLVNLNNGTVPGGVYTLDPVNARRLVFRPSLTFSGTGNPVFGFDPNETYELRILGEAQDPGGPFIKSVGGKNNTTRMSCTVQTTEPLLDPVPGNPTMTAYVTDQLQVGTNAVTFDPVTNLPVGGVPLNGATNLGTLSRVVLIFDDVMNLATIANQLNGQSNTITVKTDTDGNLNTNDTNPLAGSWTVDVDFDNLLRTVAIFTPAGGEFPSGGPNLVSPRKVVISVSNQLLDIVGKQLDNPGVVAFSTVNQVFGEEILGDDFTTNTKEDAPESGAAWGGGRLTFGQGGGSGRLGSLRLAPGETLTLNTDTQDFPLPSQQYSILSNEEPTVDYDPADKLDWPTVTINQFGEGFEFTKLTMENGSRIILTGSRAARIFARGEMRVDGVIDLTGKTPTPHLSNSGGGMANNGTNGQLTRLGGPGADAGPAGGAGGQGADRMDMTGLPTVMITVGGIFNPGAVNDGRAGVGVGGLPDGTGGKGGVHWPNMLPKTNLGPGTNPDFGDAELSLIVLDNNKCRVAMVAGPGSGGSHALEGTNGLPLSPYSPIIPGITGNVPVETPGGDNSSLDLEAPGTVGPTAKRNLEFWRKHLRGGSGGGGGGLSIYASFHNTANGPTCVPAGGGLFPFFDHSGAGGGGGGGAVMLVGGRILKLNGQVDCSGGDGGSATQAGANIALCTQAGSFVGMPPDCEKYAAPGGAGAGGSVRLQSPVLEISPSAGRILVDGGTGGFGAGGSLGGDGSPGLVRLEYVGFTDLTSDAATFGPSISPFVAAVNDPFNMPFTSAPILSVGEWGPQTFRPESFSGSQSCWLETPDTQGVFLGIEIIEDVAGAPDDLSRFGWNMDIIFDVVGVGERLFPFRGIPPDDSGLPLEDQDDYDHTLFPGVELGGVDFETFIGTSLNHAELNLSSGSLFAVRFQGVRSTGVGFDPCNLDLSGPNVTPDTLTPWVDNAGKLNLFNTQPNLVRFAVVFEKQLADFDPIVLARIKGITNMRIRVQPL